MSRIIPVPHAPLPSSRDALIIPEIRSKSTFRPPWTIRGGMGATDSSGGAALAAFLAIVVCANALLLVREGRGVPIVPERAAGIASRPLSPRACLFWGMPVDLDRLTAEDLVLIKGIGKARAAAIVSWEKRHGPIRRPEDLLAVPGITPAVVKELRRFVQ
jgi:DNA uptake protein ComE-like DNA-binding protein